MTAAAPYQGPISVLRINQLSEKLGIGVSTIYARLDSKHKYYDPTFPKQISLGAKAVGFYAHEADAWLRARGPSAGVIACGGRKARK